MKLLAQFRPSLNVWQTGNDMFTLLSHPHSSLYVADVVSPPQHGLIGLTARLRDQVSRFLGRLTGGDVVPCHHAMRVISASALTVEYCSNVEILQIRAFLFCSHLNIDLHDAVNLMLYDAATFFQLSHNWKNLRRAFRKLDRESSGYLSLLEFREVLRLADVVVDEDEVTKANTLHFH